MMLTLTFNIRCTPSSLKAMPMAECEPYEGCEWVNYPLMRVRARARDGPPNSHQLNSLLHGSVFLPFIPLIPFTFSHGRGFWMLRVVLRVLMVSQKEKRKMKAREAMPNIAAWIDQLRKAFGDDEINRQMQRGVRGEPVFHAWENGFSVGTPLAPATGAAWIDEAGNRQGKDYSPTRVGDNNGKK